MRRIDPNGKPTEREVQRLLWLHKSSSYAIMLPNYEPADWHECDMFTVTKAGYFQEFEIKLTASDFRADAEKSSGDRYQFSDGVFNRIEGRKKHFRLNEGDAKGPSRFYYVLPVGIVEPFGPVKMREIPEWAGIVLVSGGGETPVRWVADGRKAPQLHPKKVRRAVLNHAIHVCYWRFWRERDQNDNLRMRQRSSPSPAVAETAVQP